MKRFLHKLYSADGVYLTTLEPDKITSIPIFKWVINGGLGEMKINFAHSLKELRELLDNFSTIGLELFGSEIRTYIQDDDTNDKGIKIYSGQISGYEQKVNADGKEYIQVTVLAYTKTLADGLLKSGNLTEVGYFSKDPSWIIRNVIDKYDGKINYTNSSIENTGTTVTYIFNFTDHLSAINKVLELAPYYWHYYVDANNIFHFKRPEPETADHILYLGKEISEFSGEKSIEPLYNVVYFLGGGDPALYREYTHSGSIDEWGRREYRMRDERVTQIATAQIMAEKFLDDHDTPRSIATVTVLDNSIDTSRGYDIESFKPGQMVQIKHPHLETKITYWDFWWDDDSWDYDFRSTLSLPMQILEIDYQFDRAILKLSLKLQDVTHRIEDIDRNVEVLQTANIPNQPT